MISNINFPDGFDDDITLFVAVNNLRTTLNGAINASQTNIVVVSTAGFPTSGFITILSVEDVTQAEAIKYSGITATTFTATERGTEGTPALSHTSGDNVDLTVVAAHHEVVKDAVIELEHFVGISGSETFPRFTDTNDIIVPGKIITNDISINTALVSGTLQVSGTFTGDEIITVTGTFTDSITVGNTATFIEDGKLTTVTGTFTESLTISGIPISLQTGTISDINTVAIGPSVTITGIGPINTITDGNLLTISGTLNQSEKGILSFTIGNVVSAGGTLDVNKIGFNDRSLIRKLKVTPNGVDIIAYTVEFFKSDNFNVNKLEYQATGNTIFIDNHTWFHEDEDATQELHLRVTNDSANNSTFLFELTAEVFS